MKRESITCTLCDRNILEKLSPENDPREYYICNSCKLIFTDKIYLPDINDEKSRYLKHQNNIEQPGYVNFLNRVINASLPFLRDGMQGLDYGCGPSPTLSKLVARKGYSCDNYDPIFNPDHPLGRYDFIFSTEVFEHFHNPKKELEKIISLLKPDSLLCLMTEQWETLDKFENWYYKKDPTHVSFFHEETFNFIYQKYNFQELYSDKSRVKILKRKN
ncbi:MAG: class I SAM-dependent methyltransferase [Candidatus Cyclobacteriaceae bacterium M2_1C_046]